MRAPPPPRSVVPALAAAAGVVGAHALGYLAVFPHGGDRSAHLLATGHGYWPLAAGAALAAASLAVLLAVVRGATRTGPAATVVGARPRNLLGLLACQAAAFAVLEAGERALAGLPPLVLLTSPEFWLGLLLQVPVALVALRLLTGLESGASRLLAAFRSPPPRRRKAPWRPDEPAVHPEAPVPYRLRPRGPPLALTV